jgi:hypothetical protein
MPEVNMTLPELPPPAAWRETDDNWLYYDETNSPDVFEHIGKYQQKRHEVSVFALFTTEQMLALRAAAFRAGMERAAEMLDEIAREAWDERNAVREHLCFAGIAAAIRSEIAKNEQQGTERETQR